MNDIPIEVTGAEIDCETCNEMFIQQLKYRHEMLAKDPEVRKAICLLLSKGMGLADTVALLGKTRAEMAEEKGVIVCDDVSKIVTLNPCGAEGRHD